MKEIEKIMEYYLNPEREFMFGTEVRRAMIAFIGGPQPLSPTAFSYFADWFLFDFTFAGGVPPVRRFPEANPLNLPANELAAYTELAEHNLFDFFEVSGLSKQRATFTNVRDGAVYTIMLPSGIRIRNGDVIVCRIGRIRERWEMCFLDPIALPAPSLRDKQRMKTDFPVLNSQVVYHEIISREHIDAGSVPPLTVTDIGKETKLVTGGIPSADDDCAVCQAMKRARAEGKALSEKELRAAIVEQNAKQNEKRSSKKTEN